MFFKRNPISLAAIRMQRWAELTIKQIRSIDWIELRSVIILNFRIAARINILKTLLGIWCTDRRMQRNIRPCVFCACENGHDLKHILQCDLLWLWIARYFHVEPTFIEDELLGLNPISVRRLSIIAVVCYVFHNSQDSVLDEASFIMLCKEGILLLGTSNLFKNDDHSSSVAGMLVGSSAVVDDHHDNVPRPLEGPSDLVAALMDPGGIFGPRDVTRLHEPLAVVPGLDSLLEAPLVPQAPLPLFSSNNHRSGLRSRLRFPNRSHGVERVSQRAPRSFLYLDVKTWG